MMRRGHSHLVGSWVNSNSVTFWGVLTHQELEKTRRPSADISLQTVRPQDVSAAKNVGPKLQNVFVWIRSMLRS